MTVAAPNGMRSGAWGSGHPKSSTADDCARICAASRNLSARRGGVVEQFRNLAADAKAHYVPLSKPVVNERGA